MITSAKHDRGIHFSLGPSDVRTRSTRVKVPNIIHHEGRGYNAYKDKRDRSLALRYNDIFEILSLPVQNYNFLSFWHRWKDGDRV